MQGIYETVYSAFEKAIGENVQQVVAFLPHLVSALLILIIGWIIAKLAEKILSRVLKTIKIDELAEKRGITGMLSDVSIKRTPSALCGRALYWVLLFLFLVPALETLRLEYVSRIIGDFVTYIPNIIAAILIFVIGVTVARIMGAAVAASAKSAGLEYAAAIGLFIKYFLSLIILILGLSQLGIQTDILTVVFAVLIISFGLALALSLGLGSRAVVANILAGAFAKENFPIGKEVTIQGIKGVVKLVGSVTTSIETEGKEVTVPNTLLIENLID